MKREYHIGGIRGVPVSVIVDLLQMAKYTGLFVLGRFANWALPADAPMLARFTVGFLVGIAIWKIAHERR